MTELPSYVREYLAVPNTLEHKNGSWRFEPTDKFMERLAENPGGVKLHGFKFFCDDEGQYVEWSNPSSGSVVQNMVRSGSIDPEEDIAIAEPYSDEYRPMPSQIVGAQACVRQNTLLGDEMGLGKTLQALLAVKTMQEQKGAGMFRVLVVCPANLRLHWQSECHQILGPGWHIRIVMGNKAITDIPQGGGGNYVYVVGGTTIASQTMIRDMMWDVLIVDEAHEYKNPKSKRTQAVMGEINTRAVVGAKTIDGGLRARRKLYLTGTPMLNSPIETYPLLATLWPGRWMDYHSFGLYYCAARMTWTWMRIKDKKTGQVKPKLVKVWDYDPKVRDLDVAQQKMYYDRFRQLYKGMVGCGLVRRKKAQVLQDLPEKDIQVIKFKPEGELIKLCEDEERMYDRFKDVKKARAKAERAKNFDDQLDALEELQDAINSHAKDEVSEREAVGVAKGKYMVRVISEFLDKNPEDKVVVFAHHRAVVEILYDGLKDYGAVKYYGGMNDEAKHKSEMEFQRGESRVFIGNILAAGKGITLTAACKMFFVEMDWVPANMAQAMDRIHRIGQKKKCTIYNYVMAGSLDAHIAEMQMYKREMAELVLEDEVDEEMQFRMDMRMHRQQERQNRRRVSDTEMLADAKKMLAPKRKKLKEALRLITDVDSGGGKSDGKGWSSFDRKTGSRLSLLKRDFTDKDTATAMRLARKYSRQIPAKLKEEIFG